MAAAVAFLLGSSPPEAAAQSPQGADESADAFVAWARQHAKPLASLDPATPPDDLQFLKDLVGDARVVCLGESRHDAREQFLLKHRLVRFLVQEMGFTTIVLEESLPHARPINAYLLSGTGDIEALINDTSAWFAWDAKEMLELMQWLRSYNKNGAHKQVHFYGVDVVAPLRALRGLLDYLNKVDPPFAASLREHALGIDLYDDHVWWVSMQRYGALDEDRKAKLKREYARLTAQLEQNHARYVELSSQSEYAWAVRLARVVQAAYELFSSHSRVEGGLIRDRAMADNLRWIMNEQRPGTRVIVWAHNAHIARSPFIMPAFSPQLLHDMIYHITEQMGEDLLSIGATFNSGQYDAGAPPGPVSFEPAASGYTDAALARVGTPVFLLDLRKAPPDGPVADWLDTAHMIRGHDVDQKLAPRKAFDALYFVDRITRTQPGNRALARFRNIQNAGS